MFSYDIKIPHDRVAVLIGTEGKTKRRIENLTDCTIDVESREGEVNISGEDGIKLYSAQHIIKAIARGFNPTKALRLQKHDYVFELIDLYDYHDKKNHHERMKGRVIGKGGKSRRVIEELGECSISVYGKTIGIIASAETAGIAKKAVEMLLEGSNHSTVFTFLERKQREQKIASLMGAKRK
jgi:ribosomal RNA assembly protein